MHECEIRTAEVKVANVPLGFCPTRTHKRTVKISKPKKITVDLTSREIETLKLSCFSNEEIGTKLDIGRRTIEYRFDKVNLKLNSYSKVEALVKALNQGIIKLEDVIIPER